MAALAEQGHRVVLVTATRGELGEIPDGLLATGESLAERRKIELDEACRILGVARQIYLDYLDSGMAGEDTNHRPGSLRRRRRRRGRRRPGRPPRRARPPMCWSSTTSTVGTVTPITSRSTGWAWPRAELAVDARSSTWRP